MTKRHLQIDEDLQFQRKEWFAQRIGLGVLAVIVLAALLGLTGMGGPLSHGQIGNPGGALHVEYDRVVRRGAKATMSLHLRTSGQRAAQFWLAAPYFDHVKIDTVAPQPDAVSVEDDRHVYTIHAGSPDVTVVVEVEHKTIGWIEGEVGLVGGPSARFTQVSLF